MGCKLTGMLPATQEPQTEHLINTFDRIITRLLKQDGKIELGKTSDMGDRYIIWYPVPESAVYVRFLLCHRDNNPEITIDSNLTHADKDF